MRKSCGRECLSFMYINTPHIFVNILAPQHEKSIINLRSASDEKEVTGVIVIEITLNCRRSNRPI